MLQIKTIIDNRASEFDREVNEALCSGWTLCRRHVFPEGFIAEMERNVITDDEKCCENCKYIDHPSDAEPCASCTDEADKWEAAG